MTLDQFINYTIYLQGSYQEYDRLVNLGWGIVECKGGCVSPNCKGWYFLPLTRTHK